MKKWITRALMLGCMGAVLGAFSAHAESSLDFDFNLEIPQSDYEKVVKPVVNLSRFMFVNSGVPSSGSILPVGVEVGVAGNFSSVPESASSVAKTYLPDGEDFPEYFVVPRLVAQVGVPFGVDIALNYAMVPDSEIQLMGFAGQYGYTFSVPVVGEAGVSGRAGYTTITGMDELKTTSTNFEGLASAKLGLPLVGGIEAWGGYGFSKYTSETSYSISGLNVSQDADWTESYLFMGAKLSLTMIKIAAEANFSLSDSEAIYSIRAGVGI